jgi:hypothetical protein
VPRRQTSATQRPQPSSIYASDFLPGLLFLGIVKVGRLERLKFQRSIDPYVG